MILFRDRQDAGRQLAQRLVPLIDKQTHGKNPPVVLGLPRGGVMVAAEIARALHAPLDVLVVRKLGAPAQPELAIGAVTGGDQPRYVLNRDLIDALGVDEDYLTRVLQEQFEEVQRRESQYRLGRKAIAIEGRSIIVVDDGIATGATVRAGIQALRQASPAKIILAIPVGPPETLEELKREVDEVVSVAAPSMFTSVGRFYEQFEQTTDDEVIQLLAAGQK